jgi:uncharacterized protein YcbK (DUF882 family)
MPSASFAMKRFYATLAVAIALASLPNAFGNIGEERRLDFYHTHTGKQLSVTYFRDGGYQPEALEALNRFLSDWRNGKGSEIDPELLDILWEIQEVTGNRGTYEVISAYRSPETNAMLRSRSSGVAKNSQHLHGKAIDVRLRGLNTQVLRDAALDLKRGGVGYYAKSDFVHVDTGRVRSW